MRDLSALEAIVDERLEKRGASSVLGDAETTGGAVARGAAYAAPLVGTGLSFADSWNDFKHGNIGWGLANLGLGVLGAVGDVAMLAPFIGAPVKAGVGVLNGGLRTARFARAAQVAKGVGKSTLRHLPAAALATAGEMVPVLEKRLQGEIDAANAASAGRHASPEELASVEGRSAKGMAPGWNAIGKEEWNPFKKYEGEGLDGLHGYRARMRIPPKAAPIGKQFGDDRLSPGGPVW